ncbi:hypothetical protein JB92DRAFT_2826913 [Gautieria morchelliformis]|nr:hypothetical protein JB92DRAFT_2826913 [Gautieria morchelliformis]
MPLPLGPGMPYRHSCWVVSKRRMREEIKCCRAARLGGGWVNWARYAAWKCSRTRDWIQDISWAVDAHVCSVDKCKDGYARGRTEVTAASQPFLFLFPPTSSSQLLPLGGVSDEGNMKVVRCEGAVSRPVGFHSVRGNGVGSRERNTGNPSVFESRNRTVGPRWGDPILL